MSDVHVSATGPHDLVGRQDVLATGGDNGDRVARRSALRERSRRCLAEHRLHGAEARHRVALAQRGNDVGGDYIRARGDVHGQVVSAPGDGAVYRTHMQLADGRRLRLRGRHASNGAGLARGLQGNGDCLALRTARVDKLADVARHDLGRFTLGERHFYPCE